MAAHPPEIRDYESALAFLFGRIDYERTRSVPYRSRRFKLDRMRQLASRLGNPEQAFPAIHIAGTKGKGSTAVMMAMALTSAGYRTGLYTSPHLERLEERFVIDRKQCTADDLVDLLSRIQPEVAAMDQEAAARGDSQGPTYFEITTAAALLHFQRLQVDCAVVEVGLGGRLDSTNICRPSVSVVCSISFDHTRQLGKTLASIAREKAGIIKPNTPVVTGVTQEEPFEVIQQIAAENDCRILALGEDFHFDHRISVNDSATSAHQFGVEVDYREDVDGIAFELDRVSVGMPGQHQAANASVALAALNQLRRDGWRLNETAVRHGLANARCPARFEVVGQAPTIVLDAAHNRASVEALMATFEQLFPTGPRILVFSSSIDKDVPGMLRLLVPHFEHVILTRYLNNPRARDPAEMARMCEELQLLDRSRPAQLHVTTDPNDAWRTACRFATPAHRICVTGSFFLAAEVRPFIRDPSAFALGQR